MAFHSKRHKDSIGKVDKETPLAVAAAIDLLKSCPAAKFDETVELAVKLNVDPKKSDQLIRGAVSLPKGIGKTKRVIVFAEGEAADKAKAAGAIEVGSDDLAKKVTEGWMDFDVAVATPSMMRIVGKLGKVLGPQGKMPSPKSGTVTNDVETAVAEFQAGKIEFRVDANGNVHAPVGKRSFATEDLSENIEFLLGVIMAQRPSTIKGVYMQKASVSSTMGPGVPLRVTD